MGKKKASYHQVRIEPGLVPPLRKEADAMGSTVPRRVNRIVRDHFAVGNVGQGRVWQITGVADGAKVTR